ncbi:transposase [Thermosediminibacter litoriperuensis]|uniref:transposase n=1 Tax=Thermosediminibacter litoriperuensis TaxID=291989 RepID=UPI0011E74307
MYAFLFTGTINCTVRQNGQVLKKAAYVVISTGVESKNDVLGVWMGEKYCT